MHPVQKTQKTILCYHFCPATDWKALELHAFQILKKLVFYFLNIHINVLKNEPDLVEIK